MSDIEIVEEVDEETDILAQMKKTDSELRNPCC